MAAPITHIVLTEKIFNKIFPDKNRKDFFIGTVFPDIRYLGCVKREETHLSQISLKKVQNEGNSFMAGFKFHSLVDNINTNFIHSGIFANSYSKYYAAVDFVEEELFYNKISDWNEIIAFFKDILPEEKGFNPNIKDMDLKKWHQIIQNDFREAPNNKNIRELARAINFSEDIISKILQTKEELRKDKKIIEAIKEFYNNFEFFLK
ncbi:MAG: hypothetical protein ACOZAL_00930 [Patescibacteria group bacterium]